jgi:hypothetical protein
MMKDNEIRLEIKLNNAAVNDPCALCGERTDPELGPELFLGGTWSLVCYECGAEHAPELVECLIHHREFKLRRELLGPVGSHPF